MPDLILFNKPCRVLSQFSDSGPRGSSPRSTLAAYIPEKNVYPAGRLDKDSEGLLLLTADGALQHRISHPRMKLPKTYWVQVEGEVTPQALEKLRCGVSLKEGLTRPAQAAAMAPPVVWEREPPIRQRRHIPTSWIELRIHEGRNRQVRRMTAAVGFPALRLIRYAVGDWTLDGLAPGEYRTVTVPGR